MKKVSRVFYITVALVIIAVAFGAIFPDQFEQITGNIKSFVATRFGWYYMLLMSAFVIFSIFIALSPYGQIRLGKDDEKPDFQLQHGSPCCFQPGWESGLFFTGPQSRCPTIYRIPHQRKPDPAEHLKMDSLMLISTGDFMSGLCTGLPRSLWHFPIPKRRTWAHFIDTKTAFRQENERAARDTD